MPKMLEPGDTIGILGGGQLGRMMAVAASRLGFVTHIFDPDANSPAGQISAHFTNAPNDDIDALTRFATSVDVVTYEFENIPTDALDAIEATCPIFPNRSALAISQDRLSEKEWLAGLGLTPAPFAQVDDETSLQAALAEIGTPAILKTRRFGYDGKGQARITTPSDALPALAEMAGAPCVLEGFVNFSCEISVIGARGQDGQVACYDPGENVHKDGILRTTKVPANISAAIKTDAVLIASRILTVLEYVGVMGVELFVTPQGLIVNEIAPRVHNSGHWTQDGSLVDQFEQHIRAVAGWPLSDASRIASIEMENLIGDDMDRLTSIRAEPAAALHLYGKTQTRPGRKMGHVNRTLKS